LLLVAFLLVNAPNCHLSLVLASVVQGDEVNCNRNHWFNRFAISQSNLYSLCEVVCGCKAMQSEYKAKEFARVRTSQEQATATH